MKKNKKLIKIADTTFKEKKQSEKFLGIKSLCKNITSKINALARVAPYVDIKMKLP